MSAPATDLLALLNRYAALRSPGDAALKSAAWNLAKARRGRAYQSSCGGAEYCSGDVREELRAQALLEWRENGGGEVEEPGLVEEGPSGENEGEKGEASKGGDGFVLHLDGMRAMLQRAESSNDAPTAIESTGKGSEGLRRRRGNPASDEANKNTNKWTSEAPHSNQAEDEEARLRNADPLTLFGVPPPALRAAQAEARRALAYYVEAANAAREAMEMMKK